MDLQIREASHADFLGWRDMAVDYDPGVAPIVESAWQRFHSKSDPYICLLAVCDGRVAGFAHYTFHDFCFGRGLTCYVSDLYVSPEFRRRGIARALLAHLCELGKSSGWGRIYWVTDHRNPARALYDEVGNAEFVRYHLDLDAAFHQRPSEASQCPTT